MENLNEFFAEYPIEIILFWILTLVVLWWWISRQTGKWKNRASELQDRIGFLEGELDSCRKTRISVSVDTASQSLSGAVSGVGTSAAVVTAPVKEDLKIVEGIGPKIEELFNKASIYTFAQLADTPVARMKEILDNAGSRFQIHDPTTWADQAALARDGKWVELKKWQDELYKGRL